MRLASRCPALALGLAIACFAALPARADAQLGDTRHAERDAEIARALPEAADWAQLPPDLEYDPLEYDPLLDDEFDQAPPISDPFERTNRAFLNFNRGVDRYFLEPVTRGYRFLIPRPVRNGVRRVFLNLNSPSILVNDLLQLQFKDAGETFGRFVLNTTIGIGGVFDIAEEAGWEYHSADFGQTLAKVGISSGPYLMVPILGPNTVRDGVGDIVDILFQPLTYLIGPTPNIFIGTGGGFAEFEARGPAMHALEQSSVDYYAALRSAYLQNREALIRGPDNGFSTDAPVDEKVQATE